MKVYQAYYSSASEGWCCYWGTTKTGAQRAAYAAACDDGICNEETSLRQFPVIGHKIGAGAAGLVEWLNTHFTRDNG